MIFLEGFFWLLFLEVSWSVPTVFKPLVEVLQGNDGALMTEKTADFKLHDQEVKEKEEGTGFPQYSLRTHPQWPKDFLQNSP